MTLDQIEALWPTRQHQTHQSIAWWNNHSKRYTDRALPHAANNIAMAIIEKEGILNHATNCLDVGCGVGRLSFALEKLGIQATGIDFSDQMLKKAIELNTFYETRATFYQEDWENLNLEQKKWQCAYDIVLAHMTPAVHSMETLIKLNEASRRWVILVKPTRRCNSILGPLRTLLHREPENTHLNDTWALSIATIWTLGYCPHLEYKSTFWESKLPLDEAIESYTLRLNMEKTLNQEEKSLIRNYLNANAEQGQIDEKTKLTIAALYWEKENIKLKERD